MEIRVDDLSSPQTRALLALHLDAMRAGSPPDAVFALDLSGLSRPGVTVWTAWDNGHVLGMAALRQLDTWSGELKSMRTHPDHLRRGVAAALLRHLIDAARQRGWHTLSLETGRGPDFEPALRLYRSHGFLEGPAFADYPPNPFSQFFHLQLDDPRTAGPGDA